MEQFEVVFEPIEGYEHIAVRGEKGELIVRLVPKSSKDSSVDKTTYFTKITADDRAKVKGWLEKQKGKTDEEKEFLQLVQKAVMEVDYDYWIANLEPAIEEGKIYYAEGERVGVRFSCKQWAQMAKDYAPEMESRLSNLYELVLWYALRIANGLWTLEYVAKDSSSGGNYYNVAEPARKMEKTGSRVCGGHSDGQGNTFKIVTCESGYALVGGAYFCNGLDFPVAGVYYNFGPYYARCFSSGVLVLTKEPEIENSN